MILTGPEIERQVELGRITLDPWVPKNVGPNSVDLRLHNELKVYDMYAIKNRPVVGLWTPEKAAQQKQPALSMTEDNPTIDLSIPEEGFVLQPGNLYLGRTVERVHTDHFVPKVDGRSSIGRLGMQVHVTAGFCDTGFSGTITLEITVVHPLRVLPGVRICQVCFTEPRGEIRLYEGRYQDQVEATPSRFHVGKETVR